jgi:hypothetical protein
MMAILCYVPESYKAAVRQAEDLILTGEPVIMSSLLLNERPITEVGIFDFRARFFDCSVQPKLTFVDTIH